MFYRVKGHCCCSFFLTVEGLITTKVLKGQRHCCITYLEGGGGGGGGQESLASCMSSRELRSGAESFRMPAHLSCLQVQPLLGKELRTAKQGIAGQCGQLTRCTEQGSRTVVHLTDEHAQR